MQMQFTLFNSPKFKYNNFDFTEVYHLYVNRKSWLTREVDQLPHCFPLLWVVRAAGVYIIHQGKTKYKETEIINAALWKKHEIYCVFFFKLQ